jgi:hypothetical protein
MNTISLNAATPAATPAATQAVAEAHATTGPTTATPSGRPFNFSVLMGEFLATMQRLRTAIKDAESSALQAQWHIQKSSLDAQAEHIKKTFDAAITSGVFEIFGGVAAGGLAAGGGMKSGVMGLEIGSQLGSGVAGPLANAASRIGGGALTQEASDAQMRADFGRNSADAHGRLVGTLADDASAIRQEYLSTMRTLMQMQQDIQKSVEMPR